MTLTTTLSRLLAHDPCVDGWAKLTRHLGLSYDPNAPINLLTILESNGVMDCLWALRATEQDCRVVARLMACDFAEAALPTYEREHPGDTRPRIAIETARRFARGEAPAKEMAAAWAAARTTARTTPSAAASAAAWAAVKTASNAAAWATARDAAWEAARDAAWAAVRASARDEQSAIIRRYLAVDAALEGEGR